jgi:hypothetical protein
MNLVWIIIIFVALVISIGVFLVSAGIILYFTRRWRWWVRGMLVCVPAVALVTLWGLWLGPHEMTDAGELAARFELVFRTPASPLATDIHYQLSDGPDDMAEWFRFRTDAGNLARLSPDLRQIGSREFYDRSSQGPKWWLAGEPGGDLSYYRGTIPTAAGKSPSSRDAWIAYDRTRELVYCYIHSLL